MTISYLCIYIASLMPIVFTAVAKYSFGFSAKKNLNPREHLAKAEGYGQRANWAQLNSWEAFAPFAAGVIIAHQAGVSQSIIDLYAVLFIIFRVLYGITYIANLAAMRSIVWFAGMYCIAALFFYSW